jgi:hypothetical protein
MRWLAVDIGGANLKIADGQGFAVSRPFALWRAPDELAEQLRSLIAASPPADHLAVTMTGELADCFATKREGVHRILRAVETAFEGGTIRVYLCDGQLVPPEVAACHPYRAAASNWHALARFAVRYVACQPGLLVDIGSTTTDLIPLAHDGPAVTEVDDTSRLIGGTLVYTGVERSPVFGVAEDAPYRGSRCPLAQELFATMRDVYLVRGELPEDESDRNTADGRPATRQAARYRLARSLCADAESFDDRDALLLARALADSQLERIVSRMSYVVDRMDNVPQSFVMAGQGEFLAKRTVERFSAGRISVSLAERLGPSVSRCAPAHALATIARETQAR